MTTTIVGYRQLTDAEIQQARVDNGIPSNALVYKTDNGQVVFFDLNQLLKGNPMFLTKSPAERSVLLRSKVQGVYAVLPLMPIYQDSGTGLPTDVLTPQNPNPVPLPNTPPAVDPFTLSLAGFVQFSKQSVERQYIKNSMTAPSSETVTVKNISTNIAVQVQFQPATGVSFTPGSFTLQPQQSVDVVVSLTPSQINGLPEGTNTLASAVKLSAVGTPITPPAIPTPPPVQTTPPPNVGTGTWLEERFTGSPRSRSESQIFSFPPYLTKNVDAIEYGSSDITQEMTIRWTGAIPFTDSRYVFKATVNDGIKVFVDGVLMLDAWKDQTDVTYTRHIDVTPGMHTVVVWYYNSYGTGNISFSMYPDPRPWIPADQPEQSNVQLPVPTNSPIEQTPLNPPIFAPETNPSTSPAASETVERFSDTGPTLFERLFGNIFNR